MQALEALLDPGKSLSSPSGHVMAEARQQAPSSTLILARAPDDRTLRKLPFTNSGELVNISKDRLDPSQLVSFIVEKVGKIDAHSTKQIQAGEITLQDILRAGLNSLRSNCNTTPISAQDESLANEKMEVCLRTDRILMPINEMRVHATTLPDLYANHLRVKLFSTIAAIRANAELLGLTFEQIICPDTESPFYAGRYADQIHGQHILDLQHLKQDLRPTKSQIKYSHHPYIDLIPCPTFRERCIEMISSEPPMIDEDDLCQDVENDGLICWGSYAGSGSEATGSGAPWDIRSWEAQPWFLKKWWLLVGGTEGKLFQQSRWWHELRGDQLPDSW